MSESRPATTRLTPREQRPLDNRGQRSELAWAEPFHEEWLRRQGLPRPLRFARSIRAQWRESRPTVKDDELVLGRFGICSTIWHSEYGGLCFDLSRWQELRYQVERSASELELLDHLRDEWEGRDFPGRVTQLWSEQGLTGDLPGTALGPWAGHASQDYRLFLELGAKGMRERIARGRAANPGAVDWYDSLNEIVEGVCEFAEAVRRSALDAAEAAATAARRLELLDIAAILERCPAHAVNTFREAVQTFWILFYLNGADSCSRLDQDLGSYLDRDLAAGRITEHEAREIISSLWVRFDEYRTWSVVIGGTDAQGRDACNSFTRMALEATQRLGTQAPNLALRVHPRLPEDTLRLAGRVIAGGGGMPSPVNDEPVIDSLVSRGVSLEDARDYALTGCAQVVVPGRSYEHDVQRGSLPAALSAVGERAGSAALRFSDDVVLTREDEHERFL